LKLIHPTHPWSCCLDGVRRKFDLCLSPAYRRIVDARPAHLQKYAAGLRSCFPAATIIVVKASSDFYFTAQEKTEALLSPIIDILRREMQSSINGVLVHVLSNGGGFQFMTLQKMLSRSTIENSFSGQIPAALVLDSTPGDNGMLSSISSMAPPNPILRLIAVPFICLLYALFFIKNAAGGNGPIFTELRTALHDGDILPHIGAKRDNLTASPRLYIYSARDKMTPASHVEKHIAEARRLGLDVDVEKFDGTPHVGHMRADSERYWGAVSHIWSKARTR